MRKMFIGKKPSRGRDYGSNVLNSTFTLQGSSKGEIPQAWSSLTF